ncbi:hypothetical protein LCGC14_0730210 [marine sediment metagenome]|uniref:Peptidase S8/S53 domain-containing protein n=1 Tax=marine sediment metagenome TaxID=412755 RepID=A0A0F9SUY8_9ZZZZ
MKTDKFKHYLLFFLVLTTGLSIFSGFSKNFSSDDSEDVNYYSFSTNDYLSKNVDSAVGLKRSLINWGDSFSQHPAPSSKNTFSYQDNSVVKIREDNKIELIIKRNSRHFNLDQIDTLSNYGVEIYKEIPSLNSSIIYVPLILNNFLEKLSEIPGIKYVEPNFYDDLAYVPNDTYYATYQYDLQLMGMETAWNYQLGSSTVRVAVLDTGIDYTHPDLSANYLSIGYDWVNSDSNPMDDNNHGSHVAGTIAATIGNAMGVAGMSRVAIFAEKILDSTGSGSHADFRSGMIHAVNQGADIISYSGGGSDSATKREGVDYAINNGVMVIAAAGNDNVNTPLYPAAYPGVIAVSATDQNDVKASFSNYGSWIDVSAPGVAIASTGMGNSYWLMNGTSMATPHVSGLAALIKSEYPSFTSSEIESVIIENAVDLGTPGFDIYYGWGRISALNIFETPHKPFNPSPSSGATRVGTNPTLSVDVRDTYGDSMDVYFHDASNNNIIGIDYNVPSGGRASITWSSLNNGTTYNWYAITNDGVKTSISTTWSFRTNYRPNIPANPIPSNNLIGINLNPILSVSVADSDGDQISTSFYNAFDNSLIGTDSSTPSGAIASVLWSGLSEGTQYQWYAVISDGLTTNVSPTWTFTTNFPPNTPFNPIPRNFTTRISTNPTLTVDVSDFDSNFLDVSFYDSSGDILINTDHSVLSGSTASVLWSGLSEGTTYNWYVVASDGIISTTSPSWSFTSNYAPRIGQYPSILNGTTKIGLNPVLSINVSDYDGDSLNVSFYNAFNDSLIGIDTEIASGSTASITWNTLKLGTEYCWYVIVSDGLDSTTSLTWEFKTNYAPDLPNISLPFNNTNDVNLIPILSVNISDFDDDIMNASFYDATSDILIGIDYNILNGETASILWPDLHEGANHSWYVVITDGISFTKSPTWTFRTFSDTPVWENALTNQVVEFGYSFSFQVNATDYSGINNFWINNTAQFFINSNGEISNNSFITLGEYDLEIRAIDPFDNYCSAVIKIIVQDTINPTWIYYPIWLEGEFGSILVAHLGATDLSGIHFYQVNDTINFVIDGDGMLTNATILNIGIYSVEIRAYDSSGNYVSTIVTFIINPKTVHSKVISGYNIFVSTVSIFLVFLFLSKIKVKYKTL